MEKFEAQMLIKVANRNPFYKQPLCLALFFMSGPIQHTLSYRVCERGLGQDTGHAFVVAGISCSTEPPTLAKIKMF